MSKYSKYGKELDEIVRKRFSDFEKIEDEFKRAERAQKETPIRNSAMSEEYYLKAMKCKIAYEEAKKKYQGALKMLNDTANDARKIRESLLRELKYDYKVNPNELDRNVVDLLTSGICKPSEVNELFENSENPTTKRYIAQYAKNIDRSNMSKEDALIYLNIADKGETLLNPEAHTAMKKFNVAVNVVDRCTKNTGLVGYWNELTEGPLSEM